MSILVSVRTEEDTVKILDQLAKSMDRNRNWVINEAINNYLELHAWQLEQIQKGMADSDAGRTFTLEQVRERIKKLHHKAKAVKTKAR